MLSQWRNLLPLPANNCLILEGKMVLNYTHPWRHVINVAADFVWSLLRTSISKMGSYSIAWAYSGFQAPWCQKQCCQWQHIDHNIPKRETLDHPLRERNIGYRFLAFWPRLVSRGVFFDLIFWFLGSGGALAVWPGNLMLFLWKPWSVFVLFCLWCQLTCYLMIKRRELYLIG